MFTVVVVVYVAIFASFLAVLLKMRTRWRIADASETSATAPQSPEADTPYGPRGEPLATVTGAAPGERHGRPPGGAS
jgi:cytochrome d ubiquinol oxidase subunit I